MMGNTEYMECPFCKEEVREGAVKCRHCHSLLDEESLKAAGIASSQPVTVIVKKKPAWKSWFVWAPVVLVITLLIISLSGISLTGGSIEELAEGDAEEAEEVDEAKDSDPDSRPETGADPAPQPVTAESIRKKYVPKFDALEQQVEAELRALFNSAMKEYEEGSGGLLFQLQLVNKYMREIQRVEDKADAAFYSILDQMEKELKSHNLPTGVIAELEEDYKKDKQAKKRELTDFLKDWSN